MRRPFAPDAMRWKLEDGVALPYIDRGLVVDRLNLVIPDRWSDAYDPLDGRHLLCQLTIDGVTRQDVGEGDTFKERYSDALKRAAVKFGVGAYLLRLPRVRIRHDTITPRMLARLRADYAAWLAGPGVVLGEPIDHGPSSDPTGDTAAKPAPARSVRGQRRDELVVALLGDGNGTPAPLALREVRGLIAAAGLPNVPVDIDREHATLLLGTLSDPQAERLQKLLDAKSAWYRDR